MTFLATLILRGLNISQSHCPQEEVTFLHRFDSLSYFSVSGLISDLDLDNLDLDSATDPVDLDSLDGMSVDLKLDDL